MTESAVRPAPPFRLREGLAWEVAADADWRLATVVEAETRTCRRQRCGGRPVAALLRGRWTNHGQVRRWWLYCADHLYGRWIEDGAVLAWRAAHVDASRSSS